MKTLDISTRFLMGGIFILFGLSKFYPFMPTPPMTAKAANFIGALVASGYLWQLVGILEILGGTALLFNKSTNLGLILLGPIVVNIVSYLLFLQLQIGLLPIIMSLYLIISFALLVYRRKEKWYELFFIN